MGTNLLSALPRAVTMGQYIEGLRAGGLRVCPGSEGTYWVASGDRLVQRIPMFRLSTPTDSEVSHALRETHGLIATYVAEPTAQRAGNAWLYICTADDYNDRQLPSTMQRNVRRAMRELTIAPLTCREILDHGAPAFCDTRQRTGLDDGTQAGFRNYFGYRIDRPGEGYLGAWKEGRLAAFLTLVHVDDWVELGCFSMDSMLSYRPNDLLMHSALSYFLSDGRCRVVSYGLSSIQARSNAAGLHRFKRKVGFDTIRVHRAFVPHPTIRRFTNALTLTAAHMTVKAALRFRQRDRRLQKIDGMLASMRGVLPPDALDQEPPDTTASSRSG